MSDPRPRGAGTATPMAATAHTNGHARPLERAETAAGAPPASRPPGTLPPAAALPPPSVQPPPAAIGERRPPARGRASDLAFVPRHSLAAALEALATKGRRKILVTSHARGAGRSSFVASAGRAVAETGRGSVALVDADSQRPALHHLFGLPSDRGLAELLDEIYLFDITREAPGQFGVGDWLEVLRAQRRTGRLNVHEDERTFTIAIARGHACGITCSHASPSMLLGALLVERGRLNPVHRDEALRIHQETARPLGEVLSALGYVREPDLADALHTQCGHWLVELIALRRPECWFDELAEPYTFASGAHRIDMPEADGLERFLSGRVLEYLKQPFLSSQTPSYLRDTRLRNLKVLTAGMRACDLSAPANLAPFELLVHRLARAFDIVLIDGPPVSPGGPALSLASRADGVLLVVAVRDVDSPDVQGAVDALRRTGAEVLGAVLNHVSPQGSSAPSRNGGSRDPLK